MTIFSSFQPNQIVCIQQGNTQLFAEVIQVSDIRPMCWIRPLLLCEMPLDWDFSVANQIESQAAQVYDLREGVDLLWPLDLLRAALDTEVMPLLTSLSINKPQSGDRLAQNYLRDFTKRAWQSSPDTFRF